MTSNQIKKYKNLWENDYREASEFYDYISFPADNVAYDHILFPKNYKLKSLKTENNLSDHSATIIEIHL